MFLYHGTSKERFEYIVKENKLRVMGGDDFQKVSMSLERSPAEYWANQSAWIDNSYPIVISLSVEKLLHNGHYLVPFSDPIWGEGKCDWEKEVYTGSNILLLSDVMVEYEEIPRDEKLFEVPFEDSLTAYVGEG